MAAEAVPLTSPGGTNDGGIVCSFGASADSGEAFSYACALRSRSKHVNTSIVLVSERAGSKGRWVAGREGAR